MESNNLEHIGLAGIFVLCSSLFWTAIGISGMLEDPRIKSEADVVAIFLSAEEVVAETGKKVLQLPSLTPPEISTSPDYAEHFCRELGGTPEEFRVSPPSDGSRLVKLICDNDSDLFDLSPGADDRTLEERALCSSGGEVRHISTGSGVSEACVY